MAYAFGYGHGMGFGLGFLNFIGTILFIIFLIWAIRYFVRGGRGWNGPSRWRGRGPAGGEDEAVKEARERLARGEISAEEFETIQRGLRADATREDGSPIDRWFRGRDSAMDLARLRFARGEISLEEFETIKKGLQG